MCKTVTVCTKLQNETTTKPPSTTIKQLTDLQVLGHATQSESQKASNVKDESLVKKRP